MFGKKNELNRKKNRPFVSGRKTVLVAGLHRSSSMYAATPDDLSRYQSFLAQVVYVQSSHPSSKSAAAFAPQVHLGWITLNVLDSDRLLIDLWHLGHLR